QVRNTPAAIDSDRITDPEYSDPAIAYRRAWSCLNESRFAPEGIQIDRKTKTRSQEKNALQAATLTLIITRSWVLSGRTAMSDESVMSFDQKSGLENPFPIGSASIIGIARAAARIRKVLSASRIA